MKRHTLLLWILPCLLLAVSLSSCRRTSEDVWEDTKTASRHVNRGFRSLGGKNCDSRQVCSRDEFYCEPDCYASYPAAVPQQQDFIPLEDDYREELAMADSYVPQPRECPGDPGSRIPGIDAFCNPASVPGLARVFQPVRFEYNSDLVKGQNQYNTIHNIADYMRSNPRTYVFVEGHCDERGPEAYNLALGSRRANSVRNMLIQEGVSPDQIFTISYGKERPSSYEHTEEAWAQNRRAEFKVYQR